jgi:DNA recombination protein RmuC
MNIALIVVVGFVAIILVNGIIAYILLKRLKQPVKKEEDGSFQLLLQQMHELSRTVDGKMSETNKQMGDSMRTQFGESQKLVNQFIKEITQMTDKMARVEETGKQMVSFADQMKGLQEMLKNPKQRGVLGEYYLETLLKNILPGNYQMQYHLGRDDEGRELIVDAAVFVQDKIIPIDSKFSLENYNRVVEAPNEQERERLEKLFVNDLKNRLIETSKYIRPQDGTMDFAFMFIPHEAIYYDLLVNKIGALRDSTDSLIQQAASKYHVIVVSPTSFLAYLQTVLQGLKALKIEESAKEISKKVGELHKHLLAYQDYHRKLGNALTTTVNQFNLSDKEFRKIDKDMLKITGETMEFEVIALEKPEFVE